VLLQTLLQPSAVLDLHFQPTGGKRDICAVASSTGTISLFRLSLVAAPTPSLEIVGTIRVPGVGPEVLFLACAWHPLALDILGVTTSTGKVLLVSTAEHVPASDRCLGVVNAHALEAWTVAFSTPETNVQSLPVPDAGRGFTIYSGGDDSTLQHVFGSLHGEGLLSVRTRQPAVRIDGHRAGVTAVLPLDLTLRDGARLVATGSYDDCIRIFAVMLPDQEGQPAEGKTRLLAENNLGGGVWRLKLIGALAFPEEQAWRFRILASCMHAGVRIVEIEADLTGKCRITTRARFEEHGSMNYGSDCRPGSSDGRLLCVSTSFYDRLLCLWAWDSTCT